MQVIHVPPNKNSNKEEESPQRALPEGLQQGNWKLDHVGYKAETFLNSPIVS